MPPSLDSTPTPISTNYCKPRPGSMKGLSRTIVEHSITCIIYYLVGSVSWEKMTIHYCVHNKTIPFHIFLPLHCLLMIWLDIIFFQDLTSFIPFHYNQFCHTTHWIVHDTHSLKTISLNSCGGLKAMVNTIKSSTFFKVDDRGGDSSPLTLTWWLESSLQYDLFNVLPNPPTIWPFIKPLSSYVHDPRGIGGPSSSHVWCTIDTSFNVKIVVAMCYNMFMLLNLSWRIFVDDWWCSLMLVWNPTQ